MDKLKIRHSLLLLLTASIWGVAFVAQSVGMDYVGPLTFNCVRSLLGGVVLIPCIWFLNQFQAKKEGGRPILESEGRKENQKKLMAGGILCGILLCLATNFQQMGIAYTTVGKAGFITAFYIVIVPILGMLFHRKCGPFVWLGVFLALSGLYFLCMGGEGAQTAGEGILPGIPIGKGDFLVFIGALLFSVHIMVIDYFTQRVDGVKMSCIQFWVCGALSGVAMFLVEEPHLPDILMAWQPILYAGVLSCGVAYTLQIVGQKGMNPTVASLILSLESVISVLAGMILLGQHMAAREILGCVLMFAAIILAQLPEKGKKQDSL
ncbi:MAG: DMT family transporter [Lachnospiraceae bacterium]|jgi:drug/metabolite transporter (DMT)-like permease|nr:DMT family transporter [Lachnospiraceae bacterium]